MSASPDQQGTSNRRTFLISGVCLTAGAVAGWLAARGLPYRFIGGPSQSGDERPSAQDPVPPSAYTNFARVTSTAEEVIIDFCINANPFTTDRQEIKIAQRIIMNFPTAKVLFRAMGEALQAHEKEHGPIELDIRKRVKRGG